MKVRRTLVTCAFVLCSLVALGCSSGFEPGTTEAAIVAPRCVNFTFADGYVGTVCLSSPPNWNQQIFLSGEDPVFSHGDIRHVDTGYGAAAFVCDAAEPGGVTQAPYVACWTGGTNYSSQRVRGAKNSAFEYNPTSKDIAQVGGHYGRSAIVSRGWLSGPGEQACPYQNNNFWTNPPYNMVSCGTEGDYAGLTNWREDYGPAARMSGTYPGGNNGAPCIGYGADGNYATVVYDCPVYP